jgi:transglutaminase-like putative cysteine protease
MKGDGKADHPRTDGAGFEPLGADRATFVGTGAFGRAYRIMLENDAHAPGSVDRKLAEVMIRLCPQTARYLYTTFSPLHVLYRPGSRPILEDLLGKIRPARKKPESFLAALADFTRHLGDRAEQDLPKVRIGGTEEEIIARGSDWCTDVARVACVLCQVAGFPCRMVMLFDLEHAYSGHVIIEARRRGVWGAVDASTGVVYRNADGRPASVRHLMNRRELIEAHRANPDAFYSRAGQFQAAGIANYFCWEADRYDFAVSGVNEYYHSILEMSNRGWPGGLRWLHGEDGNIPR